MNALVKDINITLWDISCERNDEGSYNQQAQKMMAEASLNKRILQDLKPNPKNNSGPERIKEVKFDPKANVSECFKSAIKCWTIMKPLCIDVCD